jgi:zinc transport system ATP-binding protein
MTDELILHGISHAFGERQVLDDVDLIVPPGRIVGLLGPNGAGKSTLMRVLFGVIEPDAGSVRVARPERDRRRPARLGLHAPGARAVSRHARPRPTRVARPAARRRP